MFKMFQFVCHMVKKGGVALGSQIFESKPFEIDSSKLSPQCSDMPIFLSPSKVSTFDIVTQPAHAML